MDREQILRTDFPSARKGWSPPAVRAHLEAIAASIPTGDAALEEPTLSRLASDRIRRLLEAAEEAAGEIQSAAQAEADARLQTSKTASEELLAAAKAESEQLVTAAEAESEQLAAQALADASAQVAEAARSVDGLAEQAESIRTQVADLDRWVRAAAPRSSVPPVAEVPGPVIVPEPTPPTMPEPTPDPMPEPTPDPVPEPIPDPAPEPTPDPMPEPPVPEPAPEPPAAAGETTEDLIAQLRAGPARSTPANGGGKTAPASGSDLGAARLVAMNLALDGNSRDQISTQLESEFGQISDVDGLLDEILARAER